MPEKNNDKRSRNFPKRTKNIEDPEAKKVAEPTHRHQAVTVVGIGASAGGLMALSSFLEALAPDTGMAFVVVTHLHPAHESYMAELLQKHTRMPTRQVMGKVKVEPNHVYVIPPNRSIRMTDTQLETTPFEEPRGKRTPIDSFFRSLASEHHESIAVILSGSGTDGAVGIKDVKEVGGVILVQHPGDAEYSSMPRAAIDTGLADIVLPAAQLAVKLNEFAQHRPQIPHDPGQLSEQEAETLRRILAQVYARTGHDFNQYKSSTILRRVERRMQLNGFISLEAYLNHLRLTPNESQAMFNDILIGVTNFFRDREAWQALQKIVIPQLFEDRESGSKIRAWSIGCATGEEAYGLAMLLFEQASRLEIQPNFQIFASDLDEGSIARAREGIYPAAIEADVSSERLERFFVREGEYYRVKQELRDVVLFTSHNVLRDPPFSRQDLIACRNVLIYLQRAVQDKVFHIFNYALHPGGYLFLGSSESVEQLPEMFEVLDKTHRLYRVNPGQGERSYIPAMPLTMQEGRRSGKGENFSRTPVGRMLDHPHTFEKQHERILEQYAPPSIVIDKNHMILHVSETAGRFLLQPKGPVTGDLLKLVRPELQMELRTAILQAFEKDRAIVRGPVSVQFNGHPHRVVLAVRPHLENADKGPSMERRALVLFLENELDEPLSDGTEEILERASQAGTDSLVAEQQAEIRRLKEQLEITIAEFDTSNEEMKAANEELQSLNEEYRSAAEELETSKEELQSVNEELQTVNNDMKNKLEELSRAHHELENLMGATEIGTLFLDRRLQIQRFTAGVNDIINVMSSDRGRPISHLTHRLKYDDFTKDAEHVLTQLVPFEREVQTEQGGWYLLRFRPYRTTQDHIVGVVITFINITALKESQELLRRAKESLEERVQERTRELEEAHKNLRHTRDLFHALFNANPVPTALTRAKDDMLLNVNVEFVNYFGLETSRIVGHSIHEFGLGLGPDLGLRLEPDQESREEFIAYVKHEGRIGNYEMTIKDGGGEFKNVLASVQYVNIDNVDALVTAFVDITDRVKAEQQVRSLATRLTVAEQAERQRISQILHDDLQQRIFAVKMQLRSLQDAYQRGNVDAGQEDYGQIQDSLDETIAITRNLSIDLSPAVLQGEGLAEALGWLAGQMREKYELQVDLELNGVSTRFNDTLRIILFQAVREALFNVVKHSSTLHAMVRFEKTDHLIRMTVSDNGKGFELDRELFEKQTLGGLTNLKHRLNLMGCSMQIHSEPGKGTQIMVDIPMQQVKE